MSCSAIISNHFLMYLVTVVVAIFNFKIFKYLHWLLYHIMVTMVTPILAFRATMTMIIVYCSFPTHLTSAGGHSVTHWNKCWSMVNHNECHNPCFIMLVNNTKYCGVCLLSCSLLGIGNHLTSYDDHMSHDGYLYKLLLIFPFTVTNYGGFQLA